MTKPTMTLEALHLFKHHSAPTYHGTVKFQGDRGEIKLNVDSTLSEQILKVVAAEIIAHSERLATQMTASLIQQVEPLQALTGDVDLDEDVVEQAQQAVEHGVKRGGPSPGDT